MEQLVALLNIGLAAFLGGVLGYERESARKPAGLRTHVLVATATAVFVTVGNMFIAHAKPPVSPDPMKLLEAIATGISFLGAGTIVFRRRQGVVEGLTTAASLLLVGAIAVAACSKLHVVAIGVTLFALIVLRSLAYVEARMAKRDEPAPYREPPAYSAGAGSTSSG
jgi:putative Mg2+ transporter-C (MgtC) family protein